MKDEDKAGAAASAKESAEKLGLNMDDIRKGWERVGPIVRPIAAITRTRVDDALVKFLDTILAPTE